MSKGRIMAKQKRPIPDSEIMARLDRIIERLEVVEYHLAMIKDPRKQKKQTKS